MRTGCSVICVHAHMLGSSDKEYTIPPCSYTYIHKTGNLRGTEVRIYKRKQESKKNERKHALDQESNQENDQEKNNAFLVESMGVFSI